MKTYSDSRVLEEFYLSLAKGGRRVHIPRSEVFYVRRKYFEDTGHWEELDRIERAMYLEGMLDAHDVFEPERERDWEDGFKPR